MTDAETSPAAQDEATPAADPAKDKSEDKRASTKASAIWMGTAVGIGSAALVAALMYAKRRK